MYLRRSPAPGLQPNPTTKPGNSASIEPPRVTPRNSDINEAIKTVAENETPYGTLRRLANLPPKPSTPLRRASSAGPPSHRSLRRTPAAQSRTPGASQRLGGEERRTRILTPHGRAAWQELESRRAGLTPAKDRRRSGKHQRETPRDVLRELSRVLAPTTRPVVPTPPGAVAAGKISLLGNDDLDDDAALERPRLSLALENDEDDDDSLLLPPHSTGLEDENFTVQSVELPRRAISEQPLGRLSRGSFGSIRVSDHFVDLNQGGVFDSSFGVGEPFDDNNPNMGDVPREETINLRDLGLGRDRTSIVSGRDSDIRPLEFTGDETENTFVFTIPQRGVQEQEDEQMLEEFPESPKRQSLDGFANTPIIDVGGIEDWDEVEGTDAEDPEGVDEPEESRTPSNRSKHADLEIRSYGTALQEAEVLQFGVQRNLKKKKIKVSKHGIQYPSLPTGVVKKLATTYARTNGKSKAKISNDTLDAILQASDWFFEQVSDDLGAYANHAGRKTIDESDVITLMRRQRFINTNTTTFSLAQRHLPRELLQELRMVPPFSPNKAKQLAILEQPDEMRRLGSRLDDS